MIDALDLIAERDRILEAMDIAAAKAFIVEHGGTVSKNNLDWERVLHLARFEATSLPETLQIDSQIFLAQTGAQSVATLPPQSPYLRAALDLMLPRDVFMAEMDRAKAGGS